MKTFNIKQENQLFQSIFKGNLDKVKEIVTQDPLAASTVMSTGNPLTPLIFAYLNDQLEIFNYLLTSNIDIQRNLISKKCEKFDLFCLMTQKEDMNSFLALFIQIKQDLRKYANQILFAITVGLDSKQYGFVEKALDLLVPTQLQFHLRALKLMAIKGKVEEFCWLYAFTQKRVEVDAQEFRHTKKDLIKLAVQNGHLELALKVAPILNVSLSEKFDPNNQTLLHISASRNQMETLIALEKKCPKLRVGATTFSGDTVLHFAASGFKSMDQLNKLIDTYQDSLAPLALNSKRESLLHKAAEAGNIKLLFEIKQKYPQLNFNDKNVDDQTVYDLLGLKSDFTDKDFICLLKKMISLDGIELDCLSRLTEGMAGTIAARTQTYKVFSNVCKFFYVFHLNLESVFSSTSEDFAYRHLKNLMDTKFDLFLDTKVIGLDEVLCLPVKNDEGKTVLQLLIEQENLDALTLFLLNIGTSKEIDKALEGSFSKEKEVSCEDEEESEENTSSHLRLSCLFKSLNFEAFSESCLNTFNWALARCQVKKGLENFCNKKGNDEILEKALKVKVSPYYGLDLKVVAHRKQCEAIETGLLDNQASMQPQTCHTKLNSRNKKNSKKL